MTQTLTYEDYEAAKQASAMLAGEPTYARSMEQDPWLSLMKPACSGSSGIVTLVVGYGPILPHVGSSSSIVDRRPAKRALKLVVPEVSADFRKVVASPLLQI